MDYELFKDAAKKLDHPLEDVRLRWLKHCLQLMESKCVLCDESVIQLILKLLEWLLKYPRIEEEAILNAIWKFVDTDEQLAASCGNEDTLKVALRKAEESVGPQNKFMIRNIIEKLTRSTFPNESRDVCQNDHRTDYDCNTYSSFDECESTENSATTLPWSYLSPNDIQRFDETIGLLEASCNMQKMTKVTNVFIYDLLEDYPSEVFLQYPALLKRLLAAYGLNDDIVKYNSLKCLNNFTMKLVKRIQFFMIPAVYYKQEECLRHTDEDTLLLQSQQLSVEQYITNVLKLITDFLQFKICRRNSMICPFLHVEVMNHLLDLLDLCKLQSMDMDDIMKNVAYILDNLRSANQNSEYRLLYICFVQIACKLHCRCKTKVSTELVGQIDKCVMDPALALLQTSVHKQVLMAVSTTQSSTKRLYQDVKTLCDCLESAIDIRRLQTVSSIDYLQQCMRALPSLEVLCSDTLIQQMVSYCTKSLSGKALQHLEGARELLLKLLSHKDSRIQGAVYKYCYEKVKLSLGVTQVHRSIRRCNIVTPLSVPDTGIPISPDILIEIASHGALHSNAEISSSASNILSLMLNSKMILNSTEWAYVLENIIAALPILQCIDHKESSLGRIIHDTINPDTAVDVGLSYVDILRGNIRLLFSKDREIREESLSRLLYLISQRSDAACYIPDLTGIGGTLPSNLCIIENKPNMGVRITQPLNFYQITSIPPLLEILSDDNAAPAIRKSVLLQLSVILKDPYLHTMFSSINDLQMILKIFPKALAVHLSMDLTESLISIIAILRRICIYNSTIRKDLSSSEEVIIYILRALLLFHENETFRLDCAQLLFLLCWSTFLVNNSNGLSAHYMLDNMILPCIIPYHDRDSPHSATSWAGELMKNNSIASYIRFFVNTIWFGGVDEILQWHGKKMDEPSKEILKIMSPDINENLRFSIEDYKLLSNTSVDVIWTHYINVLQSASSHDVVRDCFYVFTCISELQLPKEVHIITLTECLEKFFRTPPGSTSDRVLLAHLLNFIRSLMKYGESAGTIIPIWIIQNFQNSSQPVVNILKIVGDVNSTQHALNLEVLTTISSCLNNYRNLYDERIKLDARAEIGELDASNSELVSHCEWNKLLETIIQSFLDSGLDIKNIQCCSRLISCISSMDITTIKDYNLLEKLSLNIVNWLWLLNDGDRNNARERDLENQNNGFAQEPISEMTSRTNFYSYNGASLVRAAFNVLSNILYHMKMNNMKWEQLWFTQMDSSVLLLSSFCESLDIFTRSSSFQIFSGLMHNSRGCHHIMETLVFHSGTFWMTCLNTLLNMNECSLVRYQAGCCLVNLTSHVSVDSSGISSSLITGILDEDVNPYDAIMILLNMTNFYEIFNEILGSLCLETSIDLLVSTKYSEPISNWEILQQPGVSTIVHSASNSEGSQNNASMDVILHKFDSSLITPDLLRVCILFLHNLTFISPGIADRLSDKVLLSLMKCIQINTRDMNSSVNKMIIAICYLLCRVIAIESNIIMTLEKQQGGIYCLAKMLEKSPSDMINGLFSGILRFFMELCKTQSGLNAVAVSIQQCDQKSFFATLCFCIEQNADCDLKTGSLMFALKISHEKDGRWFSEILDNNEYKNGNLRYSSRIHLINLLVDILNQYFLSSINDLKGILDSERYIFQLSLSCLCSLIPNVQGNTGSLNILQSILLQRLNLLYTSISSAPAENLKKLMDRKIHPEANEIKQILKLSSFLYMNMEFKRNVCLLSDNSQCDALQEICHIIHKLFPYCKANHEFLHTCLMCICNLTEECPPACKYLGQRGVLTYSHAVTSLTEATVERNVLSIIINMICRYNDVSYHQITMKLLLSIMENCCKSLECRLVIHKSNILSQIKLKQKCTLPDNLRLWLNFLECHSGFPDGQLGLANNQHTLSTLLLAVDNESAYLRRKSLIILRNISFNSANRSLLLNSRIYIEAIISIMKKGYPQEVFLVLVAIWNLAANNQKAKNLFRTNGLYDLVNDASLKLSLVQSKSAGGANLKIIKYSNNLLDILNNTQIC